MSNENWNDPAKIPSQPQEPYGQPSVPDPLAPLTGTTPEAPASGSLANPNYTTPSYTTPAYTPPAYGTPETGSAASNTTGYSAPNATPSYGTPATGGYAAPDTTPNYGSVPTYGNTSQHTPTYGTPATGGYTAPNTTPAYGTTPSGTAPSYGTTDPITPSYGSTPAASYGSTPEPTTNGGYTDPNQAYGAAGGYAQTQPGQYGTSGYGQPTAGYQDPGAAYGATANQGYPAYQSNGEVSAYGYDSGYANAAPQLATFGNRALGWAIDWFAPSFVAGLLASMLGGGTWNTLFGLAYAAFVMWNSGYQAGVTGYSLGRRVAKTKLISETTGQPVGANQGLLRAGAQLVMNLTCVAGFISWLFPLWDPKRQTLADKFVKSVVVSDPNAGQAPMQ